jgi:hypothetical protein
MWGAWGGCPRGAGRGWGWANPEGGCMPSLDCRQHNGCRVHANARCRHDRRGPWNGARHGDRCSAAWDDGCAPQRLTVTASPSASLPWIHRGMLTVYLHAIVLRLL